MAVWVLWFWVLGFSVMGSGFWVLVPDHVRLHILCPCVLQFECEEWEDFTNSNEGVKKHRFEVCEIQ